MTDHGADVRALIARLDQFFGAGGFFNTDLMEPDKMRNLLLDCRMALLDAVLALPRPQLVEERPNCENEDCKDHMPEVCICAALQLEDGRVIRGHRHDDCIGTAIKWRTDPKGAIQGFQTSRNRFVGRAEAMQLQRAAGIIKPEQHGKILFSEDLY